MRRISANNRRLARSLASVANLVWIPDSPFLSEQAPQSRERQALFFLFRASSTPSTSHPATVAASPPQLPQGRSQQQLGRRTIPGHGDGDAFHPQVSGERHGSLIAALGRRFVLATGRVLSAAGAGGRVSEVLCSLATLPLAQELCFLGVLGLRAMLGNSRRSRYRRNGPR